jgi:hypothetical protein
MVIIPYSLYSFLKECDYAEPNTDGKRRKGARIIFDLPSAA